MESFGRILKSVREEKQIDIEQIAGETSISKEYLIALEEENLEVIPGSTYTVGFLRNYSDYLGCDTKYLLDLYEWNEKDLIKKFILEHCYFEK